MSVVVRGSEREEGAAARHVLRAVLRTEQQEEHPSPRRPRVLFLLLCGDLAFRTRAPVAARVPARVR